LNRFLGFAFRHREILFQSIKFQNVDSDTVPIPTTRSDVAVISITGQSRVVLNCNLYDANVAANLKGDTVDLHYSDVTSGANV